MPIQMNHCKATDTNTDTSQSNGLHLTPETTIRASVSANATPTGAAPKHAPEASANKEDKEKKKKKWTCHICQRRQSRVFFCRSHTPESGPCQRTLYRVVYGGDVCFTTLFRQSGALSHHPASRFRRAMDDLLWSVYPLSAATGSANSTCSHTVDLHTLSQ